MGPSIADGQYVAEHRQAGMTLKAHPTHVMRAGVNDPDFVMCIACNLVPHGPSHRWYLRQPCPENIPAIARVEPEVSAAIERNRS